MSLYVIDIEADGPCPGLYSMIQVGIVKVTPELDTKFIRNIRPITDKWIPEALAVSGFSREEVLQFDNPEIAIKELIDWVEKTTVGKPVFISDNNGFDWQFVNYYCHAFANKNPFGFSSRRIGDLYAGLNKDFFSSSKWKSLKKTKHTHNALDDAMGNAEAILAIAELFKIKIPKA